MACPLPMSSCRPWVQRLFGLALGCGVLPSLAQTPPPLRLCGSVATIVPASAWQAAGVSPGTAEPTRDAFVAALLTQYSGLATTVIYMPSRRCITETAAGRMDGVMGLSVLPERMALIRYPMRDGQVDRNLRLNTLAYYWYSRAGLTWQWDGKTLSGSNDSPTIGVIEGYSVATLMQREGRRLHLVSSDTTAVLRMLTRERFDLAMLLDIEVTSAISRHPELAGQIRRLEPPYVTRDYYLALSPALVNRQPEVARRLWNAIPRVRQTTAQLKVDPDD